MWKVTIKGLLANKFRFLLTSLSVVLGVAFVAGTFVLTDTMSKVFDDLFADTTKGVATVVRGTEAFGAGGFGNASQDDNREPVPESLLEELRDVDGVAEAEGSAVGLTVVVGADGQPVGGNQAPSFGAPWGPAETLNQSFILRSGRRPTGPGEVAIDEKTAEKGGLRVGDEVQLAFATTPPQRMRLVGTFSFGEAGNLAGASLSAFAPEVAQQVLGRNGTWDSLSFAADPDVSEVELTRRIQVRIDELGAGDAYEAVTGTTVADEQADQIKEGLSFFTIFLLIFGFVALFVGAFIIYNTFSITVAQRLRELALLRALGASGRQVTSSVALEALVVGVVSSVVGLVGGVLLAIGLQGLLSAFGLELPSSTPVLALRTVVWAFVIGILITVVSAVPPALRAARVPPVAAMKESALAVRQGNRRYWIGGVATIVGLALLFVGLFADLSSDDVPGGAASVVGSGAFVIFVGVAMLSPLVARPAALVIGWPSATFRGVAGRLARGNAMRDPRRTAATAAALMIGLTLVTFISVVGASATKSFSDSVDRSFRADFVVSSRQFPSQISPDTALAVQAALAEATVVVLRAGSVHQGGETTDLFGTTAEIEEVMDLRLRPGAALDEFATDGVLVYESRARSLGVDVGDTVQLTFARTGSQEVPVRGIFTERDGLPFPVDFLLSLASYEENYTDQADSYIGVKLPEGASVAEARRALDEVEAANPSIQIQDREEYKDAQIAQANAILNIIQVLLTFAVFIALIGVVNTLALSIIERTRELGLLRAVGMTKRQLKRMVRSEAIIVTIFGVVLGLVLGIFFALAVLVALSDENVSFSLPVAQLAILVVLVAIAGLLAGSFPARRAAKLDVLQAIGSE